MTMDKTPLAGAASKVAIITAAGSGMGADAARRLAAEGFRIAILSSSGRGEALAQELGGIGLTGSNRSVADLAALVGRVTAEWGRIDLVVNSAGHGPRGEITQISDEAWRDGMEIYLMNVIRMSRLVVPIMTEQNGGVIVNISSYGAKEPSVEFPTSSVMRAALSAYAKIFSQTYAARNVRMNNILPGFIRSMDMEPDWANGIAMGRFGEMREVSSLIAYLASDDAAYLTGQDIVIDGGLTKSV